MSFESPRSKGFREIFRASRASIVAAVVVSAVVMTLGFILDRENSNFYRRELHIRTENDVALIHARIMGQISTDFSVLRNLANWMALAPDMPRERVAEQIQRVLLQNPHFRSVSIAPDFVVKETFPARADDITIGEDVRRILGSNPSAALAADRLSARFAGPVVLGEDHGGFVLIFPVITRDGDAHSVWGAVRAIIDETQFYRVTGLLPAQGSESQQRYPHLQHLKLALSQKPAPGLKPHVFFGDARILDDGPVQRIFSVPGGAWVLAAIPADGWDEVPPNQAFLRLVIALTSGIIVAPVFLSCLLMIERSRNVSALQARETKLLEVSQRLHLALESSKIGIWEVDRGDAELLWDGRTAQLHGFGNEDMKSTLADWLDMVHPQDRLTAETHFFTCSVAGAPSSVQYRIVQPDGAIRHLRSVGAHYSGGSTPRTIGIVWDVTADVAMNVDLRTAKETSDIKNAELELALSELSSREQELEELSRKLDLALDSYRCGTWEVDLANGMQFWDERMHHLYELPYTDGRLTTGQWLDLVVPEDRQLATACNDRVVDDGTTEPLVVRKMLADGSLRYIRSIGKVHRTKDGRDRVIGIAFDFTSDAVKTEALKSAKAEAEQKNIELQFAKSCIEHNALHDPLTMLGNRRKLDVELEKLSEISQRRAQSISILHIDLDRFKQINDTLGHAAGDAMLEHAAAVLEHNVRSTDLVARIGGDEFVIVVTDNADPSAMAALATRVIEQMRQPIDFEGFSCRCGVSIGIAQASGMYLDTRQMLVNADIALYRAKATGRNRHEFFTLNLQAEIVTAKRVADDILVGLEKDQFTAWYQPQFDARTMKLTGVEALVRWNHPEKGILTPDRFLRIADELNVVSTLDRIVLETALQDRMRWAAMGIDVPKVSVNVSSRRLHEPDLYETLQGLAIQPGALSFELVESIFLDESEDIVSHNLDRIKSLGIDIEIDDFGTGHTSIVSLLKLRPHRLKIDRQLVQPILESAQERALVRSIIEIAHSLDVKTVAEGVESFEHTRVLRDLGCDTLQGYAFAKPLSFDAFCDFVRNEPWRKAG